MPTPKAQRLLAFLAIMGTLVSCFGCTLAFNNQMNAARVALIVAWIILVPLFVYLIVTRRRSKSLQKQELQAHEEQLQKELEALATIPGAMRAGREPEDER